MKAKRTKSGYYSVCSKRADFRAKRVREANQNE